MSSCGNSVKEPVKATIMARLVNSPNTIVGMKLDRARIEKPATIVIDVKYMALPILLWQKCMVAR